MNVIVQQLRGIVGHHSLEKRGSYPKKSLVDCVVVNGKRNLIFIGSSSPKQSEECKYLEMLFN